ncbi:hypothetical protein AVEN_52718-1 [Araneus ventricosus]|uniref:Uncharacterized protein n=1 Tax=Araneus ventricosus TaxID=182803 RepID=A0A4Y2II22_ARAVE|nr:hypothetical protein AVEN_52718-1 [Araneus ventricosus]
MSPSAAAIPNAGSADMPISYFFLPPSPLLSEIPFYCPPLPEIPILCKTICLSIGYFLSDSEALALPKCRTFIYAMEPTNSDGDNSESDEDEVIETSEKATPMLSNVLLKN